jgi:hypothetical protein
MGDGNVLDFLRALAGSPSPAAGAGRRGAGSPVPIAVPVPAKPPRAGVPLPPGRGAASEPNSEIGMLALVVLALLKELLRKGVISEGDLLERIREIDAADGRIDGVISPERLARALGLRSKGGAPAKPLAVAGKVGTQARPAARVAASVPGQAAGSKTAAFHRPEAVPSESVVRSAAASPAPPPQDAAPEAVPEATNGSETAADIGSLGRTDFGNYFG